MRLSRLVPSCAVLVLFAASASAAVSVPSFFSDHIVLQREAPIPVWGWADPGEKVTVQLAEQPAVSVTAAADGIWKVALAKSAAGGPFTLVVKGGNEIRIVDVLVGEVWLCSGQSNMEFTVDGVINSAQEKTAATDPLIRQLAIPKRPLSQPDAKLDARWTVGGSNTVGGFTACGYFMARELRKQLGVPVGLIHSSWGGTRIEPWTTPAGFKQVPALSDISRMLDELDPASPANRKRLGEHLDQVEEWTRQARKALAAGAPVPPAPVLAGDSEPLASRKNPEGQPTTLYNGMIHALVGYGMRGAIWYQGESNHWEGMVYTDKMKALIGGWRAAWGIGDFPFNFVQIAPFEYGGEDPNVIPRFWLAQSAALKIPNTGMVVTTDIGDVKDIHPRNKQEVGRRLALLALARTYGKEQECEGPTLASATPEGDKMRVTFDHATGLTTRDGMPPTWFEIIGESGDWVKADAVIDGKAVMLSAAKLTKPQAVRFAWHRNAEPNLTNAAGLPAPTFTAGGVAYSDQIGKVAEAAGYELVYQADLARLGITVPYEVDQSGKVGAFDRIGYFLELQFEGKPVQYVWTAMDAFTTDARKIAIPVLSADATFQQAVTNLTVASNVKGIAVGNIASGAIEFWPNNYGPANVANVAGASAEIFDFGDQMGEPKDGYGCMQVHNVTAKQTIFAINQWKGGGGADLGIGNSPGKTLDWTFVSNAGTYVVKKLRVFVRLKK